jgi:nucleotide-binding universal stress UspA family protein
MLAAQEQDGKMLVCVDHGAGAPALIVHAEAVGHALQAPLALAHVLEPQGSGGQPEDPLEWNLRRRSIRQTLAQLAAQCHNPFGEAPGILLQGSVAEQLSSWIVANRVRLVALSTRAKDKIRTGLGSTASHLLELAPASVLLVPPDATATARYRRILVPLDGSYRSESVLPTALALARYHGSEILLAHVVPEVEVTEIGPLEHEALDLRERLANRNERVARLYLDRLLKRIAASGVPARAVMARGDARDALRRLVSAEQADFVLLSAQGHGSSVDAPCGKVSAYLATHAMVPTLIVRETSPSRPASTRLPLQPLQ